MGVNHDAARVTKSDAKNHVGRLSSDAWQANQLLQSLGNVTIVVSDQSLPKADQILRLLTKHAQAIDARFDALLACLSELLGSGKRGE